MLIALVATGYLVLSGPMRDSDAARAVFGDPSREDARGLCLGYADQHLAGSTAPAVSDVRGTFDETSPVWTFTGQVDAGEVAGPFSCTIEWSSGGATAYLRDLTLPDGSQFGTAHRG